VAAILPALGKPLVLEHSRRTDGLSGRRVFLRSSRNERRRAERSIKRDAKSGEIAVEVSADMALDQLPVLAALPPTPISELGGTLTVKTAQDYLSPGHDGLSDLSVDAAVGSGPRCGSHLELLHTLKDIAATITLRPKEVNASIQATSEQMGAIQGEGGYDVKARAVDGKPFL